MQRILKLVGILGVCLLIISCHPKTRNQLAVKVPTNPHINSQLGNLFLAKNKLKEGIVTLPSGLQYSIIKNGMGDHPKPNDLVTVFYQGQFIDGSIFDNQHAQRDPVTIRVSAVIPGWQEALKLMQIGSIWALYVPPALAYGEKGLPGKIGPNQTLVYYIHLLNFKNP